MNSFTPQGPWTFKNLGFGLGLRTPHIEDILKNQNKVAEWFEVISENYLGLPTGGLSPSVRNLEKIRERHPVVLHGVSMNLGGDQPLDLNYLKKLKELEKRISASWVSDHLCWTGLQGRNTHDLLPLPYTQDAVHYVADRIQQVQEILGHRLVIENVSSYVAFEESVLSEAQFIQEVIEKADCLMLCDLNNIFVTCYNFNLDIDSYLSTINWDRVQQIHLAGPKDKGDHMIDTHDHPVRDEVWQMLGHCKRNIKGKSLMIERDDNIPTLADLEAELQIAKDILR